VRDLESTVERIDDIPRGETMTTVDKGKGKDFDRGRALERGSRYPNPLAKAESRPRKNEPTIELDVRPIEKRQFNRSSTFFEDPNDPCAVLEDDLLEPCPHIPICYSVSEVLCAPESSTGVAGGMFHGNTWSSFDAPALNCPTRTLTTVFNDCRPVYPAPTLPHQSLPKVRPDIDHLEYIAIVSSSPLWSASRIVPNRRKAILSPRPSQASGLPTEIVQQIFYNLAPADFNSARHTCRSWLINSLNRSLLETMLKRAGFSNRIIPSPSNQSLIAGDEASSEWLMSKCLALECALGPEWTGNGLANIRDHISEPSAFVKVSTIDFTEVAVHYPGHLGAGSIFTFSSCGRFLMVANGCLVYIYELNRSHKVVREKTITNPGDLRPVTSIVCPRRVLACSMDTSSNRYAVAILLDGRMGLVCDIHANTALTTTASRCATSDSTRHTNQPPAVPDEAPETGLVRRTSFLDRVSFRTSTLNSTSTHQTMESPFPFPGIATTGASFAPLDKASWRDVVNGDMTESTRLENRVCPEDMFQNSPESDQVREPRTNFMPIENGPRSLYRNLCSDDDPPRSVAICPQRRCVAFGCSSGIELHWVDALTGQDLNRWFPLTTPSDFLFFLPPRRSIDSAKKLRLISSAAKPGERPAIADRPFGGRTKSSPFWERLPVGLGHFDYTSDTGLSQGFLTKLRGDAGRSSLTGRMDCSDHYRAVPLSDGYHILFTDPTTGFLCLGSDAPVGGPTKLLRKMWFQGPRGIASPVAYAAGADLSCGVRVVAAFGIGEEQVVWLFSVPSDVFATNQGGQSPLSASSYLRSKSGQESQNSEWINWWPDDGLKEWTHHAQAPEPGILPRSVWPVKVRGQQIGTCSGVVDIAIDSGPDMAVWALSSQGVATVWKVNTGRNGSVRRQWIVRDGTVRESEGGGDVEMSDAPSPSPDILQPPMPLAQDSYDGTVSFPSVVQYDSEGDVLMDELPHSQGLTDPEPVEYPLLDPYVRVWYRQGWARSFYRGPMADLVEEVTGVSRIDVEIR
jgi:hypothetical protein